jgi:hypothetical protein
MFDGYVSLMELISKDYIDHNDRRKTYELDARAQVFLSRLPFESPSIKVPIKYDSVFISRQVGVLCVPLTFCK